MELEQYLEANDEDKIGEVNVKKRYHVATAKEAHEITKVYEIRRDDNLAAIAMDLQQTLPTPRLSSGAQCFNRKQWSYNFGVHDLKSGQAYFYVWNETQVKRGSSEIISCLLHYVANIVSDSIRKFMIFSDNCSGQNKNLNVVLLYLRLIQSGW